LTGLGNARSFFSLDSFQFKLIQGFASIVENTACVDPILKGAFLGFGAAARPLSVRRVLSTGMWVQAWTGARRGDCLAGAGAGQ
jgi:hypothetical protein